MNFLIFAFLVFYALIGNMVVCSILRRRGVPYNDGRNPFHMFNVCAGSPKVGYKLKLFAFSTTAAVCIVVLALVLAWI